jgi:TolB-like protein
VLDFSDLDGNTSVFGKYLAETLITDLFDSGKFQVVERRLLVKALEENKLKSTGLIDPATVKKLGQVLGVDAIVSGTITELASHVAVNARLVATDTAAVFASASEEIEKDEDVISILHSSESPAASKYPRPQVSLQAVTAQKDEFYFAVKGCLWQAEILECTVLVTNKSSQPKAFHINAGPGYTTLVDKFGHSYNSDAIPPSQSAFGIGGVKRRPDLVSNVPTSFMMTFKRLEAAARLVSINLVYSTNDGTSSVVLRNIPLEGR